MKTTLSFAMLVLAIALAAAAFGGLVGILPASAFFGSEVALFLSATAGLMLIALNDDGRGRRPIIVHRMPVTACTTTVLGPARARSSYGIRRQNCTAA
jgi:hypothetical protein